MKELLEKLTEAIKGLSSAGHQSYPDYALEHVLDNEEVARVLHTTVAGVDSYVSQKSLPYHKAGVKRLFFYGEVLEWLRSNECTNRPLAFDKTCEKDSKAIQKLIRKSRKTSRI